MKLKTHKITRLLSTVFFVLTCFSGFSQNTDDLSSNELFKKGRELTFDGKRTEARIYLKKALLKAPTYNEIRVFLARTYAWDEMRIEAKQQLYIVVADEPMNREALDAFSDVFYWNDQNDSALYCLNKYLRRHPNDIDFLHKKAKVQNDLSLKAEAMATVQNILAINPSHKGALELLTSTKDATIRNYVNINASVDYFETGFFSPAYYQAVTYGRSTKMGRFLVRMNVAEKFDTTGYQFEAEFYPSISEKMYAYLNYGVSYTSLFPIHRVGVELYRKLPKSFEASAGVRFMQFSLSSNVDMYTGTLGKYLGNYWLSARVYIIPSDISTAAGERDFSRSLTFSARRYFSTFEHFIGIDLGSGASPQDNTILIGAENAESFFFAKSNKIGFIFQKPWGIHWLTTARMSALQQQYERGTSTPVKLVGTLSFTLEYQF